MEEVGADETVEVLGSDTTYTMSGHEGGVQHKIEVKLDRNLTLLS